MDSAIATQLISASGAVVAGAIGMIAILRSGQAALRNAEKINSENIAAAREERLWEQRSAAYVDAITLLRHRKQVRADRWTRLFPRPDGEDPPEPVDWPMLEARLLAFASQPVLDALEAATDASSSHAGHYLLWQAAAKQEEIANYRIAQGIPEPAWTDQDLRAKEGAAKSSLQNVTDLENAAIRLIRGKLQEVPSRPEG